MPLTVVFPSAAAPAATTGANYALYNTESKLYSHSTTHKCYFKQRGGYLLDAACTLTVISHVLRVPFGNKHTQQSSSTTCQRGSATARTPRTDNTKVTVLVQLEDP